MGGTLPFKSGLAWSKNNYLRIKKLRIVMKLRGL